MSNAKWRRLFTCFGEISPGVFISEWKHIDSNHVTVHERLPTQNDIGVAGRYFRDGPFQPYEFKWIEWIYFPTKYFDKSYRRTITQDLSAIVQSLDKCGGVDFEQDAEGLRLYGYKH